MTKEEIQKIACEVQNIVGKAKATFFVTKNKKVEIPTHEYLCELKGQISNDLDLYFLELYKKAK